MSKKAIAKTKRRIAKKTSPKKQASKKTIRRVLKTTRRSHLVLTFLAVIAIGIGVFFMLQNIRIAEAQQPHMTVIEAEKMTGRGVVINDAGASEKKALKLSMSSSVSSTIMTKASEELIVTARGDQCGGAPTAEFFVDNMSLGSREVSTTNWNTYRFPVALAKGAHRVTVNFKNPHTLRFFFFWTICERSLILDKIAFAGTPRSETPSPSPTVTTSPSPSASPSASPTKSPASSAQPGPQQTPAPSPTKAPAPTPQAVRPVGVPGNWTLMFNDDFPGSSIDTNKWSTCWFNPTCGTQNNVKTEPSNVSVSGGNLILTLAGPNSGASVSTNPVGGAAKGFQFTTGVAEARMFFPGTGTYCYNWPAFWSNGQSWPTNGENDIAEILSNKMTVNYHSSTGAHNQGVVPGIWCGSWHTYTLHRMSTKSNVYFDGQLVKSYTTNDGNAPHYLILNIGRDVNASSVYGSASQVKVDYVRVWQ